MTKEMGVLLVEDDKGDVAVQLFAEVEGVEVAFRNLNGSPADKPRRATLISLWYGEDGMVKVAAMDKVFPQIEPVENRPDGYVIGEGPIHFDPQATEKSSVS